METAVAISVMHPLGLLSSLHSSAAMIVRRGPEMKTPLSTSPPPVLASRHLNSPECVPGRANFDPTDSAAFLTQIYIVAVLFWGKSKTRGGPFVLFCSVGHLRKKVF